jgi:hypothetical protein
MVSEPVARICTREELQDSPRQLLEAIRDELFGSFASSFHKRPANDSPSLFNVFVIRKRQSGTVDLLELDFPVSRNGVTARLGAPVIKPLAEDMQPHGPFMFYTGYPVAQSLAIDPDTSGDVIASVDRTFEAVRANDAAAGRRIGGPVDVCIIDNAGFRWLRKKPSAPIVSDAGPSVTRQILPNPRLALFGLKETIKIIRKRIGSRKCAHFCAHTMHGNTITDCD